MVSEQYAELAELAGGFIHEIKNHLGTLGLNLQLLGEDFNDAQTPREKRAAQKIHRLQDECQRLTDLANDFLRFARVNEVERVPADLTAVIEELIDFYAPTAEKTGIKINSFLPADLPPVRLNRELFKQALLNLFLNAQQAMPNGGELTVQANLETSLYPHAAAVNNGEPTRGQVPPDTVCLSIIDTGDGMSPDVAAQIFRPFFSTRPGGTGLGLPTTRKIVEAHGGTIEVQSAVGRGTRFVLRLPVCKE